eukprot:XP_011670286.1 PREDICTED: ABC transporter F family member 4-like [Strongylocentrotus purpuratus]
MEESSDDMDFSIDSTMQANAHHIARMLAFNIPPHVYYPHLKKGGSLKELARKFRKRDENDEQEEDDEMELDDDEEEEGTEDDEMEGTDENEEEGGTEGGDKEGGSETEEGEKNEETITESSKRGEPSLSKDDTEHEDEDETEDEDEDEEIKEHQKKSGRIERQCPVCNSPTAMLAKHLRRKHKNLNEEEIWGFIYQARKKVPIQRQSSRGKKRYGKDCPLCQAKGLTKLTDHLKRKHKGTRLDAGGKKATQTDIFDRFHKFAKFCCKDKTSEQHVTQLRKMSEMAGGLNVLFNDKDSIYRVDYS